MRKWLLSCMLFGCTLAGYTLAQQAQILLLQPDETLIIKRLYDDKENTLRDYNQYLATLKHKYLESKPCPNCQPEKRHGWECGEFLFNQEFTAIIPNCPPMLAPGFTIKPTSPTE